ncbi:MAG: hypothetical protein QM813_05790 [Verrucomicrobiota bacterium]
MTTLVCLEGWNASTRWLLRRDWSSAGVRRLGWVVGLLAGAWVMVRYVCEPDHLRCFPIRRVAQVAVERKLVESAPKVMAGDRTFFAEVGLRSSEARAVRAERLDRATTLQLIADLPAGSIGMWDNLLSQRWYGVSVDELPGLGLEILHEERQHFPAVSAFVLEKLSGHKGPMRCVLFRKK